VVVSEPSLESNLAHVAEVPLAKQEVLTYSRRKERNKIHKKKKENITMTNVLAILAIMVEVSMCVNAQPAVKNQEFENWKGAQAKSYANDGERKLRLDL
jgi:hypothetical protein